MSHKQRKSKRRTVHPIVRQIIDRDCHVSMRNRAVIGSLLPLQLLVHQFRHRDRAENCKPICELPNSFGRVVLQLSASIEYSGGWNSPFREGALMFER